MDIVGLIKQAFEFGASIFKRITQQEAELNKPEIKENAEAKEQTKNTDDNEKAVADAIKTGDVTDIAKRAGIILLLASSLGCSVICVGCAKTYVPTISHSQQPSFDGNQQNSGIIGVSVAGFVVTEKVYNKYNALIDIYGYKFSPVLTRDHGIVATNCHTFKIKNKHGVFTPWQGDINKKYYIMTAEAMVNYLDMNDWQKSGIKAPSIIDKIKKKF